MTPRNTLAALYVAVMLLGAIGVGLPWLVPLWGAL